MIDKNVFEAVSFLNDRIRYPIMAIAQKTLQEIYEIRVRRGFAVCVVMANRRAFLKYDGTLSNTPCDNGICVAENEDFDESVRRLCSFTLHAYQHELINGYITYMGHRVGVCSTAQKNSKGKIESVNNITSLNIRIARNISGVADEIIGQILSKKLSSLLIVGEPSSGKTTILKDIAARLSAGEFGYLRVCVVDERNEILKLNADNKYGSAGYDVLDGFPKADGMMIAVRTMNPDVIVCDEIGSDEDVIAIEKISNSGCRIIASIHAGSFSELCKKHQFNRLMRTSAFEGAVILKGKETPGEIREYVSLRRFWK